LSVWSCDDKVWFGFLSMIWSFFFSSFSFIYVAVLGMSCGCCRVELVLSKDQHSKLGEGQSLVHECRWALVFSWITTKGCQTKSKVICIELANWISFNFQNLSWSYLIQPTDRGSKPSSLNLVMQFPHFGTSVSILIVWIKTKKKPWQKYLNWHAVSLSKLELESTFCFPTDFKKYTDTTFC
jgi:hypothetical protein